jgi:quercetin dioxygenase-like cupin family protein
VLKNARLLESEIGMTNDSASDGIPERTDPPQQYFEIAEPTGGNVDASGASITHMDDFTSYEIAEGLFFRPVFAQNISLNFVTFPPDSGFPSHVHPEEQISIVREGEMDITFGDITQRVKPGDVIVFPPDVPHEGRTFDSACRLIDIFSPPRTGMREVLADTDPVRSADVDRWWDPDEAPA